MRFYCIVAILLLLMPVSASAYTVESNRERANEVYQLAMTSGRMFPKKTLKTASSPAAH